MLYSSSSVHCVMEASTVVSWSAMDALNIKRYGCNRHCCLPTRFAADPRQCENRVTCPQVEKAKSMQLRFPLFRKSSVHAALVAALFSISLADTVLAQSAPAADLAPSIKMPRQESDVRPDAGGKLDQALSEGMVLEQEDRWVEALSHYDDLSLIHI